MLEKRRDLLLSEPSGIVFNRSPTIADWVVRQRRDTDGNGSEGNQWEKDLGTSRSRSNKIFCRHFSSSVKLQNGSTHRPNLSKVFSPFSLWHAREISTNHQIFSSDRRDIEQTVERVQGSWRSLCRHRTISSGWACAVPRSSINRIESLTRSRSNRVRTRDWPSETVRENLVLNVHTRCRIAHERESQRYVSALPLLVESLRFSYLNKY